MEVFVLSYLEPLPLRFELHLAEVDHPPIARCAQTMPVFLSLVVVKAWPDKLKVQISC
jgi:hypothetical protein